MTNQERSDKANRFIRQYIGKEKGGKLFYSDVEKGIVEFLGDAIHLYHQKKFDIDLTKLVDEARTSYIIEVRNEWPADPTVKSKI
jgi:hypothetical protein